MEGVSGTILDGCITLIIGFVGYFVKSHSTRIKDIEDTQKKSDKELSDHRLYSEKYFETKDNSNASIMLIRQAVDDVRHVMASGMNEVRSDIKEILQRLPK